MLTLFFIPPSLPLSVPPAWFTLWTTEHVVVLKPLMEVLSRPPSPPPLSPALLLRDVDHRAAARGQRRIRLDPPAGGHAGGAGEARRGVPR